MALRRRTKRSEADAPYGELARQNVVDQVRPYSRQSNDAPDAEAAAEAEPGGQTSLGQVGEHVASVLAAAEAAAARVRVEAEREAERTRQQAVEAAEALREQVTAEAEAERADARRQLSRAKEEASTIHADADSYAGRRRREAEDEALRLVRDAEHRASQLEDTATERHRALLNEIAVAETRLREIAETVRTIAASLDEVAGPEPGGDRMGIDRAHLERIPDEPTAVETQS